MSTLETVVAALRAAQEHLEYCGWGDTWEREAARAAGLPRQIEDALKLAEDPPLMICASCGDPNQVVVGS